VKDQGGLIFGARELRGKDGEQLASILQQIKARIGNTPCYLTLDIDCLDPAFAPGTGTPEPGGMTSSQVMTFLEELATLNFVGMDCVEVAPAYDHAELTSNAAAQFIWTYLCGQIARQAPTLATSQDGASAPDARAALPPEGAGFAMGRPGGKTST
jgi:agmatinase